VAHGQVSEDLPVHLDAGLLQAVHEDAVAHVVLVCRGVDAHDPEPAEVPLLVLAVAVGVAPAALDVLLGRLPQLAARAVGAARGLHDLLLPLQADDVRLDARHRFSSLITPAGGASCASARRWWRSGKPGGGDASAWTSSW